MAYFTYFAYGSNMLLERLQAQDRCPSARVIGPAFAHQFELCFAKRSAKDGSGKATLIPRDGLRAHGVLFAIDESERGRLNAAEGAGKHYHVVDDFPVRDLQGETLRGATTYLGTDIYFDSSLHPYDWYHALLLAGAMQNGLPEDYLADLSDRKTISDPAESRRTRVEALRALCKAGYERLMS